MIKNSFFIFIIGSLFFLGCNNNSQKKKIENVLGLKIPEGAANFEYYKDVKTEYYERPYSVYIKFKIDSSGFKKIISDSRLIHFESDFKEKMCLQHIDQILSRKLWSFPSEDLIKSKIGWWNVKNNDGILLYASFYKEKGINKIENCFQKNWDGHVLLGYESRNQIVYILIEVFMDD